MDWHLDFVRSCRDGLHGPEAGTWLTRMDREHPNVVWALTTCGEIEGGALKQLRLVSDLWSYWFRRGGHFQFGRQALGQALARAEALPDTPERARALTGLGAMTYMLHDPRGARPHLEEALTVYRRLGEPEGIARGLNGLASVAYDLREYQTALSMLEEAVAIRRRQGKKRELSATLSNLGSIHVDLGDFPRAGEILEESRQLREEVGDRMYLANSHDHLGRMHQFQGLNRQAIDHFEQGLALHREVGETVTVVVSLYSLAQLFAREGDAERAREMLAEAIRLLPGAGQRFLGNVSEAAAEWCLLRGRAADAARLFGAAEAWRDEGGYVLSVAERRSLAPIMGRARAEGGEVAWEEGHREGPLSTLGRTWPTNSF
jgi:tetratricopeptide (TPR) repeat protein